MERVKLEQIRRRARGRSTRGETALNRGARGIGECRARRDQSATGRGTGRPRYASSVSRVSANASGVNAQRAECRATIATQMQVVTAKRRDVKLLEQLSEQRLEAWTAESRARDRRTSGRSVSGRMATRRKADSPLSYTIDAWPLDRIGILTGGGDVPGLNSVIKERRLPRHRERLRSHRHPPRLGRPDARQSGRSRQPQRATFCR